MMNKDWTTLISNEAKKERTWIQGYKHCPLFSLGVPHYLDWPYNKLPCLATLSLQWLLLSVGEFLTPHIAYAGVGC